MYDSVADEPQVGSYEVLRLLWAHRWWLVVSTVLFEVAFVAAAFMIEPIYRAATVLIPASTERNNLGGSLGSALGQLGGLASLAGVSVGAGDSATEEALAVLKSRQFTEDFIADNNLMPLLFADSWDSKTGKWLVSQDDQPTPAQAYKYFDTKIRKISQDKKTGLIVLQIDWKDRDAAVTWANELVQQVNGEMRQRAIGSANASIAFLERALATTSTVETRDAISRLIEVQVKTRMLASVSPDYAFRVVDFAMTPDKHDPVSPQKLVMLIIGFLSGLAFGVAAIFASDAFPKKTKSSIV